MRKQYTTVRAATINEIAEENPKRFSRQLVTNNNPLVIKVTECDAEWGQIGNTRFLLSSIGSISQNASLLGADVYNIFVCGREAFASIEQDGYSAQFIYRPPIYDSPLALNASVGYRFAEVPRILNDTWVLNLRCTLA